MSSEYTAGWEAGQEFALGDRKTQHGVQIVWGDPVKAGAVKEGEEYVPDWQWFDQEFHATKFIEHYIYDIGKDPAFGGVAEINRGTRWAIEQYGDVEIASSIDKACVCECHIWPDKVTHEESCCAVMEAREA